MLPPFGEVGGTMVHTWITASNDKLSEHVVSIGARHFKRALAKGDASFYGDYELDVYIGTLHDYDSLWEVAAKVIRNGGGWIRYAKMKEAETVYGDAEYSSLDRVLAEFGWLSDEAVQRFLPRREDRRVLRTHVFRRDGNFKMIAVETARLYYVFCFATS